MGGSRNLSQGGREGRCQGKGGQSFELTGGEDADWVGCGKGVPLPENFFHCGSQNVYFQCILGAIYCSLATCYICKNIGRLRKLAAACKQTAKVGKASLLETTRGVNSVVLSVIERCYWIETGLVQNQNASLRLEAHYKQRAHCQGAGTALLSESDPNVVQVLPFAISRPFTKFH